MVSELVARATVASTGPSHPKVVGRIIPAGADGGRVIQDRRGVRVVIQRAGGRAECAVSLDTLLADCARDE